MIPLNRLSYGFFSGFLGVLLLSGCGGPTPPPAGGAGAVRTLTGKVKLADRFSCEGVTVTLFSPQPLVTQTKEDGSFRLTDPPSGVYFVQIEASGYTPYQDWVKIYLNSTEISLGEVSLAPEEVTVEGGLTLADGENPAGSGVEVSASVEVTPPEGLRCERVGSISDIFEVKKDAQADRSGSWSARVPRYARNVTVTAHRPGYTEESSSYTLPDTPTTAPVRLGTLTLYPLTGFVNVVGGYLHNTPSLTLQISAFNGVSHMSIGVTEVGSPCPPPRDFEIYSAQTSMAVPGDGTWQICVTARNLKGQTATFSTQVAVDTQPPGGSVLIAGGASAIATDTTVLSLTAFDSGSGVARVRLANENSSLLATTIPVSYDSSKVWILAPVSSGTAQLRIVWYQVEDRAGNLSLPLSDTVWVDREPPMGSLVAVTSMTNQLTVSLALSYSSDVVRMKLSRNSFCVGGVWQGVTDSVLWLLDPVQGAQGVSVLFEDSAGNVSVCYGTSVTYDSEGPRPASFSVRGNPEAEPGYTNTPSLLLTASSSDPDCSRAEVAEDPGFLSVVTSYTGCSLVDQSYTLANTAEGERFLYLRFRDSLGNPGGVALATIILDRTPPVPTEPAGYRILEAPYAPSPTVTLGLPASGASQVAVTQGVNCLSNWIPYAPTLSFTTTGGDGAKTLAVQYRDPAGNLTPCYTQVVTIDTIPPTASASVTGVEGVSGRTARTLVYVNLSGYSADAVEMRISNFPGFPDAVWQPLVSTTPFLIPSGDGTKTLYVQVRDRARNESPLLTPTIVLDTTPPEAPALQVQDINGDGFPLSESEVELRFTDLKSIDSTVVGYELERFVEGVDSAFALRATLPATQTTYLDDVTLSVGYRHNYRIRAVDDLGQRSAWSNIAQATPIAPITTVVWVHDTTDLLSTFFTPQRGTFNLSGQNHYEDLTGTSFVEPLLPNLSTWTDPDFLSKANSRLALRVANQENSLVYESTFSLPGTRRETLDLPAYNTTSLKIDPEGFLHIGYLAYKNFAYRVLYATNRGGSWVTEVVSSNVYATRIFLDLDSQGKAHLCFNNLVSQSLIYATNASGSWVTTVLENTGLSNVYCSLKVDSSDRVHISYHDSSYRLKYATNPSGSWTTTVVDTNAVRGYTSLAMDPSGYPHIAYIAGSLWPYELRYTRYDGSGWTTDTIPNADPGVLSLALDLDNHAHISYKYLSGLYYATNRTGSFTPTQVDSGLFSVGESSLAVDRYGNIYIAYQIYNSATGEYDLRYATNAGGGWKTYLLDGGGPDGSAGAGVSLGIGKLGEIHLTYLNTTASLLRHLTTILGIPRRFVIETGPVANCWDGGRCTSLAVGAKGDVHIAYYDDAGKDLKYATNAAGPWSITVVDSAGVVGKYPSLALDGDGKVHISYYDEANEDLKYATNRSGSWAVTTVDGGGGDAGKYNAITADASGGIHISYYYLEGVTHRLKYAYLPSGSTTFTTQAVDGGWFVGLYNSIAVDPSGKVHISYYCNTHLCYTTDQGGGWNTTVVETSVYPLYTSLALDPSGRVHIAYADSNHFELRYAVKTGGSFRVESVDTLGYTSGYYLSLAIDSAGNPHIAYTDTFNNDLKYATRASGSWVRVPLDRAGSLGFHPSIAIDPRGIPHVSYVKLSAGLGDLIYLTRFAGILFPEGVVQVSPFE